MRVLRWVLGLLMVAILGVLGYAATLPDSFRIERSIEIAAPPPLVFPLIEDLMQWPRWSPWEKRDPAMKRTFGNPNRGAGATYAWSGNSDVGEGRMKITSARVPTVVYLDLDFVKPFEAHNKVEFGLAPTPAGTRVTWTMHGPQPFVAKIMNVFVSMEKMVGPDFEAGLANLKQAVESGATLPRGESLPKTAK